MMTLTDRLKAARRVAVPLICVTTPDPAETVRVVRATFDTAESKTPIPMVMWDSMNGLSGLNKAGTAALQVVFGPDVEPSEWPAMSTNPGAALGMMARLPGEQRDSSNTLKQRGTLVFMCNAQRYFEDSPGRNNGQIIQGIWNLRDEYKGDRRTLVLLAPAVTLPAELSQDVLVFDEPYPTDEQLGKIVAEQAEAAGVTLKDAAAATAIDALRGLAAFTAEQITAMSMGESDIDVEELWQRKMQVVEQTPGLSVDRGVETFDDVRGLKNFKEFALGLIRSERAPTLYVRIDEIEKSFGGLGGNGSAGDSSGTTQDRLGVMLRDMEDNGWTGLIALGHAGSGKSLVTKSMANTATKETGRRVLSIALDLGATSNSLVGESERRIRACMKVIKSLAGGGRVCFVATCNSIEVLPPALKRRFKLGTWMFDLPDAEDKKAIWEYQMGKFNIKPQPMPDDEDWVGADIRNVCDVADQLGVTLKKACQYVTLVAKSDPEAIGRLRKLAHNRLINAAKPGLYKSEFVVDIPAPSPRTDEPRGRARRGSEE